MGKVSGLCKRKKNKLGTYFEYPESCNISRWCSLWVAYALLRTCFPVGLTLWQEGEHLINDLEYSETNVGSAQAQGVRKNISLKLKGKGRGRGRKSVRGRRASSAKKTVVGSGDDEDQAQAGEDVISEDTTAEKQASDTVSLDEVMSKLETPSFSPMERVFPEPLHQNKKLRWNHKVNLIGEKVVNPMIHCCEKCSLPILNYGRMIPCKHVFCYECAKRAEKVCPKCDDNIVRVEQTSLGSVFMCTFGGSRLGPVACGRTYLSQRDLQAHINHRHLKPPPASSTTAATTVQTATNHSTPSSTLPNNANLVPAHSTLGRDPRDPRGHVHEIHPTQTGIVGHVQHAHSHTEHRDQGDHSRSPAIPPTAVPSSSPAGQSRQYPHSSASYPTPVPVSSARPNLITVPIQDDSSSSSSGQHAHQQAHSQQYTPAAGTPAHALPPLQQQQQQQHPPGSYPPPHAYQHPLPASTPTYSQAPPITTQHPPPPPVHHPPPPMHAATVPMYSTPPPPVHHPPPATYSTPPAAPQHSSHTLPPQRFQGGTGYDEPTYMQPWTSGAVPPPSRAPMPPPRPIAAPPAAGSHNLSHIPPRGPSDQGYRPPYYQ